MMATKGDKSGRKQAGAEMRGLRERKGLTQGALGQKVDLAQSVIGKIETGEKKLPSDLIPAFADALEVSSIAVAKIQLRGEDPQLHRILFEEDAAGPA